MHSVESISNNKIKEIVKLHQKKYRETTGLFIAEGYKSVEELINSNIDIKELFILKNSKLKINHSFSEIDEKTMKRISTTDTPCEILAVAEAKKYDISDFKKLNHLLLLDSISDPGNLGTIIRSAAAFNMDGIILYGNCVDLYSPKVIRSAAGNLFKTPISVIKDANIVKKEFTDYIKVSTALSEKNNISLDECSKIKKYLLMFGSEASGLSKELIEIADKNIKLNMARNVESLNLSVSASIVMYELFINKL